MPYSPDQKEPFWKVNIIRHNPAHHVAMPGSLPSAIISPDGCAELLKGTARKAVIFVAATTGVAVTGLGLWELAKVLFSASSGNGEKGKASPVSPKVK